MSMRLKSLDMNSSLPGYDEQLYERLKRLAEAMQSGSLKSVRLLSSKIQFSSETGTGVGRMARAPGFSELAVQSYSSQRSSYLQSNSDSIEIEDGEGEGADDEVD